MKEQQKTEFTIEVYLGGELIPDEELSNLQLSSSLAHYFIPDRLNMGNITRWGNKNGSNK